MPAALQTSHSQKHVWNKAVVMRRRNNVRLPETGRRCKEGEREEKARRERVLKFF